MDRQEALVRAAYEVLAERGFEGLRTREVANRVGVNIATLHYYFPTKEALIRGVVAYALGRFRSTLGPSGAPGAQLRAHFAGMRKLAREEPEVFRVMAELAVRGRRDDAIATIVRETDEIWHATLVALLRRAAKEGTLDRGSDPGELATVIIDALKGSFMFSSGTSSRRFERTVRAIEGLLGTA
jgi:AcrR family transcriptional regulator